MVRSETRSAWLKNIATISYDPAPARSSVMPAPSAAKSESFSTPPSPFKPKLCNEIDHLGAYSFSPTSRWATLQLCTRERTTSPLVSHLAIRFSNPRICNKICNEMKRNPLYSPRFAILKGEEDNFFHHNFPFPQAEDLYLTILVESGRRRHPLPPPLSPPTTYRGMFSSSNKRVDH